MWVVVVAVVSGFVSQSVPARAEPSADEMPSSTAAARAAAHAGVPGAQDRSSGAPLAPTHTTRDELLPSAAGAPLESSTGGHTATPDEIEDLRDRVDDLVLGKTVGAEGSAQADLLYRDVEAVLWPHQRRVRAAIDDRAPDFLDQQGGLVVLFTQRDRLIPLVSDEVRGAVQGSGSAGSAAIRHEFGYLRTLCLAQLRVFGRGSGQLLSNMRESPVTTVWRMLQVALALLFFRAWRRWSKRGLADLRTRLLQERPRPPTNLQLAKALWYLDRVGGSLAWLALIFVLSRLIVPHGFEELAGLVYTVLTWIFVARLIVQVIDALAARGVGGRRADRAALRLRSLRLIGGWTVLLGLGLSLVSRYAGHGAIHSWVMWAGQLASLPVALLLVYWWRDEVTERLRELAVDMPMARRLAEKHSGLWRFPMTIIGAGYLLWSATRKWMIRQLSSWEVGRRGLAVLVRREVERDGERSDPVDEEPISPELVDELLALRTVRLSAIAESQLDELVDTLQGHRGGGFVVLGERGAGKSTFLERLAEHLGDDIEVVGCPPGGYVPLAEALASKLGIPGGDDVDERLAAALDGSPIQVIGIDDAHRLTRPWMGGQEGLDRLGALDGRLTRSISWVMTVDRRAWRYIVLARADRALFQRVFELPRWSEEELGELIDARSRALDIEPDYRRLVLPSQLDAGEHDSLAERNRFGYARILWELADGNPEVAMRLFAQSLRRLADGGVVARLPQPIFSTALNESGVETLLVLRVVVRCGVATRDDIVRSLRISPARATAAIRFCAQNGWIEEVEGGWQIEWRWFRTITLALVRKNLVAR